MYSRRPVARRRAAGRLFPPSPGRPLELVTAYAPVLLWVATGLVVTLLGLRFGMRLVGVRGDVPFPGAVYSITAPLVERFYPAFPASDRFDFPAVEVASLAAMGVVIGAAVALYSLGLVASYLLQRFRRKEQI